MQLEDVTFRNSFLDSFETLVGTAPRLKIRSSALPAVGASSAGTVLADITLPSDWLASASSASKGIANGPWTDSSADNSGTAGHYELYKNDNTTLVARGSVSATGGGGDIQLVTTSIVATQPVSITAFTLNL